MRTGPKAVGSFIAFALQVTQRMTSTKLFMEGRGDNLCWSTRHAGCLPPNGHGYVKSREKPQVEMTILRTCKQIHQKARLIQYSTYAFSFSTPKALKKFLSILRSDQLRALCVSHIDMVLWSYLTVSDGDRALSLKHFKLYQAKTKKAISVP